MNATGASAAGWRKSSYSAANNNCVEVRDLPGGIAVRDSKDTDHSPLRFGTAQWAVFCESLTDAQL